MKPETKPNFAQKQIRTLSVQTRIADKEQGIVDYIASDETIDSYREVVRASGWRFDRFQKNAPFVDSHDYSSLDRLLGSVIDYKVEGGQLIERVKWAIDVPDNRLAQLGWKMTVAGYLRAVSVGFWPEAYVTKWDSDKTKWLEALKQTGLHEEDGVQVIYTQQQQVELSAVIIGANANAVQAALKSGAINNADADHWLRAIDKFQDRAPIETAEDARKPDDASPARHRAKAAQLLSITKHKLT